VSKENIGGPYAKTWLVIQQAVAENLKFEVSFYSNPTALAKTA
jgi:hypothetical protein